MTKYMMLTKKQLSVGILVVLWLCAIIAVIVLTVSKSVNAAERKIPIYSVATEEKKIALTFNCAWTDEYCDEILETLRENNAKCTFFVVGDFALKYPEYIRKIYNEGHELANHSMKHNDPVTQEYQTIAGDITLCNSTLEGITGGKVSLYRAPSGSYDNKTIEASESAGMIAVQWSADSIDWKDITSAGIYSRIINSTAEGDIVLFHLGKENTAAALEDILDYYTSKGFEMCTVSQLIYKDNYYIAPDGTQTPRAADAIQP